MKRRPLVFISDNQFKYTELRGIFARSGIDILYVKKRLIEIQSDDIEEVVRRKALDAFRQVGPHVLVEHTGLYIKALQEMPGALTQLFWDKLGGDRICRMLSAFADRRATARTVFGFCDGERLLTDFAGELEGTIANRPHDGRPFQWGTIFLPKGESRAYSELRMSVLRRISHRAQAAKEFISYWESCIGA